MIYFIVPVSDVAQIWQEVLWFLAVTALMLEYLWDFSRRISGDYLAQRALHALGQHPITAWESLNDYSVLQSMIAGAVQRNDISGTRTLMTQIGAFLAVYHDHDAERQPRFDRQRYRTLRNLLITAAQQLDHTPRAVAYWLGFAEAGYLLQCVACGQHGDDQDAPLFSSLLRDMEDSPPDLVALITGMRHHLLRPFDHPPLLLRYWQTRAAWSADDPRLTDEVAVGLAMLFVEAERRFAAHPQDEVARTKSATVVSDVFATVQTDFLPIVRTDGPRALRLTERLLQRMHARIITLRQEQSAQVPGTAVAESERAYSAALAAIQGTPSATAAS